VLDAYRKHVQERAEQGVPPLPLDAPQVADLIELIKNPPAGEEDTLLDLLTNRVPPGVDQAAYVKAGFLTDVAKGGITVSVIDRKKATFLLGTMLGGYNIQPLIELLDDEETAEEAVTALSNLLLIYDAFHDVKTKADAGSATAKQVMDAWAEAQWFLNKAALPEEITVTVFKVPGETNTDDLSPATDAWSRPDIPVHAKVMLVSKMDRPLETIEELKTKGHPLAYVGDG